MIGQRGLLAIALIAGTLAGILYYAGAQRLPIVVAAREIDPLRPIAADDVTVVSLPPDAIPAGAVRLRERAVGRFVRAPLWRGQILLAEALSDSAAAFRSGLLPPTGTRAIALPVGPANAVGGAVVPGSRVDVVAVPIPGRAPAGRPAELLAAGVLVVDVRGEHGGAYPPPAPARPGSSLGERLGSVVVAIGPSDELRIAERVATSTFVLVLLATRT